MVGTYRKCWRRGTALFFLIEQRMPHEEDILQRTEGGQVKNAPGRGYRCKGGACLDG